MIFSTIEFAIFFPVVFCLYWFVFKNTLKLQNLFLLAASYFFYGWWDWRFLSLIIISSLVDFYAGQQIAGETRLTRKKIYLALSLSVNLGFLGVFKYFDFFLTSLVDAFTLMGANVEAHRLNLILPIGISFYTFQTMSYTIDIYMNKLKPTKDLVAFFSYVSFFPQLVAGPIERARNLLPQFAVARSFDTQNAVKGCRQILWGLFKKMVIADNCALYVNEVFAGHSSQSASALFFGALFFTFQIYGDFSGYSDIAIGTARLLGFNLMRNFNFPYFSRDIAEFWRRWHISLSSWFRDYLYIPLGGSKVGTAARVRNIFVIFLVSGFWHGANWTFIVWGAINALYFLPLMLRNQNRNHLDIVAADKTLPSVKETFQILLTFGLTMVAWIFFRSETLVQAFEYLSGLFSTSMFTYPKGISRIQILLLIVFLVTEWNGRKREIVLGHKHKWVRFGSDILVTLAVFVFSRKDEVEFIYFQF